MFVTTDTTQTRRSGARWLMALVFLLLAGCASAIGSGSRELATTDSLRSIYVARRAWHTGILIAREDWPHRDWAVLADFPRADYLEFGWGEERYYQAERNTFWQGVRAAFWPNSSVIHVIGLHAPVTATVQADDLVQVRIPAERLRAIASAIEQEFVERSPQPIGSTHPWAPTPNRFYKAKRTFYFARMCNWWIATRLRQAGCPVLPWTVITASRVMREARECAQASAP